MKNILKCLLLKTQKKFGKPGKIKKKTSGNPESIKGRDYLVNFYQKLLFNKINSGPLYHGQYCILKGELCY